MEFVLLAIMILDRPTEGEVRIQRTNPFIRRTSQFKLGIQPIQFGRGSTGPRFQYWFCDGTSADAS